MVTAKNDIDLVAIFREYLKSKNMRVTPERLQLAATVVGQNGIFSADDIHKQLEVETYHVSKATIYSTLWLLCECGIINSYQFAGRATCFKIETKTSIASNVFLQCEECGKIKEVKDDELAKYLNAKKFSAFKSTSYILTVSGVCNTCARRQKKNK